MHLTQQVSGVEKEPSLRLKLPLTLIHNPNPEPNPNPKAWSSRMRELETKMRRDVGLEKEQREANP